MKLQRVLGFLWGPLLALVIAASIYSQGVTTNSFPLAIERVDYTATAGQVDFVTKAVPRGGFVMVFWNGLLQRPPQDYTSVSVGSTQRISFTIAGGIPVGQYVSLVYFR